MIVARILHLALASSVVLYGVLAFVLPPEATSPGPDALFYVLFALAIGACGAGVLAFRRADTAASGAGGPPVPRARPAGPVPAPAVAAWALMEGGGVFGLVTALLGGPGIWMIALSLGVLLLHPPRRDWFPRDG